MAFKRRLKFADDAASEAQWRAKDLEQLARGLEDVLAGRVISSAKFGAHIKKVIAAKALRRPRLPAGAQRVGGDDDA